MRRDLTGDPMFWRKNETSTLLTGVPDKVGSEAEGLYRSGKMHCAEAVLEAVRSNFLPASPAEVVALAAGFGGGSGAGCICGAMAGGTMAIGLVLQGERKQAAQA